MIEAGIEQLLASTTAITAICGTRIYPSVLPKQPTYPAIAYSIIALTQEPTWSTRGMQRMRMEFVCEGKSALAAASLRSAIDSLLNGYSGTLSDGTVIQFAERVNAMDAYDHEILVYRRMVEFYLYYT